MRNLAQVSRFRGRGGDGAGKVAKCAKRTLRSPARESERCVPAYLAILAIGTGALAVYGRVVATAPLAISDQSEADVEAARKDVRTSAKKVDADSGQ